MNALPPILIFLATVAAMEGFAYVMHRWVMHGPGWFLHASHHRERTGRWEANDLYFVIFAMPSILLLLGGVQWQWGDWATAIDRKSTRLNSITNAHLVCRHLLEKKKNNNNRKRKMKLLQP